MVFPFKLQQQYKYRITWQRKTESNSRTLQHPVSNVAVAVCEQPPSQSGNLELVATSADNSSLILPILIYYQEHG